MKLSIFIKKILFKYINRWLDYNLDPHNVGGWESFKNYMKMSYNSELFLTQNYEKKLIKTFSFLPLKVGKLFFAKF